MLKVRDFLSWIVQNDWVSFHNISDGLEQSKLYNEMLNKFKILVEMESQNEGFSFNELYELINSHKKNISTLPFLGKIYAIANPHLLTGKLTKIAQEIEFNNEKEKLKNLICDCEIREKYKQNPNTKSLAKFGFGCDGYYNYAIYECSICGFKWSSYEQEDSTGKTVFEKWNEKELPNNKQYCH
jgi:hypothetical protein